MEDEVNLDDFWYTVTDWNKTYDTIDVGVAKQAVREGRDVLKTTRRCFEMGPAFVRLYVTLEVKKIKDL